MDQLLLGIDVGTSAVKAALVDLQGNLQAVGEAAYPLHHVRPAWVEQDPEDWWRATCEAIRRALAAVTDGEERVLGLAVSSQAPALLALDHSGKPLRPAIIWMDRRATAEAEELAREFGAGEIHRITGNRPDAFFVAPRLRWMRKHEPNLFRQARRFVQINGYINYRLTGTLTMDPVHAVLLQLRDYASGEWSASLCNACGVTPEQFPRVAPGHEAQGEVTREAATATGLRAGTAVMVGTVDGSAAALEAGVVEPGVAAEMTGTSTVFLLPNKQGLTEPALIAMPHAVPGVHLLLGAMVASGASLRWFRDRLGQPETEAGSRCGADSFDSLTARASEAGIGSDGVVFLPYMMGERSPIWNTNARGVFFGLSLATSKGAMARSILEGAAFALRHNMEVALGAGAEIHEVRTIGGCSRSELWNQIKADVLGKPLLLPQTSVGAPFGVAMLAGMGSGVYKDAGQTARDMVRIERRFEPNGANHERYGKVYGLFRRIYEHLEDDFDSAARVRTELER